jgi:Complex I intermediate-associated protein 30 (CIA30)
MAHWTQKLWAAPASPLRRPPILYPHGTFPTPKASLSTSLKAMVFFFKTAVDAIGKQYTLTVSNEIAEKRPDGRDASTIVYEYSFETISAEPMRKYAQWNEFKPMYRGKPNEGAPELDLSRIRRWSFMIRSFFDKQRGDFNIGIRRISAVQGDEG